MSHFVWPAYDVVIPAYNRAHVISDAVLSVASQTPAPQKIIVVDDASTDDTYAVLARLARTHPSLVTHRLTDNGGPARARNIGVALGSAEWIAFLDSDDVWEPEAAGALLGKAVQCPDCDVIAGDFIRVDLETGYRQSDSIWSGEDLTKIMDHRNVIGMTWTLVRQATFLRSGGFNEMLGSCEDWELFLKIMHGGGKFVHVPKFVAQYREVEGGAISADAEKMKRDAALIDPFLRSFNRGDVI